MTESKEKESPKRYYWDACVFLSEINANPDRVPVIETILDDCDQGKAEIYTSILSIAEVAYSETEKNSNALDEETRKKIDKFWLPPSPIKMIEIGEPILWEAQDLIRTALKDGKSLKPADAIHLATAKRLSIDAVHTYDEKMKSCAGLIRFSIVEPATPGRFVFVAEDKSKVPDGKAENKNGQIKPEPDSNVVREGHRGPALGQAEEEARQEEEAK
jgi:predicted nucleic acid-binding protein